MTPELATSGATSAERPAFFTLMRPALTIRAPGFAGMSKRIRPAMKLRFVMPAAETRTLAALTSEPLVNTTPDWLVMTIPPLAWMRPAITEGSGASTRFSVTAFAEGWTKFTVAAEPTLKLCQLTAARGEPCVTVVVVPAAAIRADPATTTPPEGNVSGASWARAGNATRARTAAESAVVTSRPARSRRSAPISRPPTPLPGRCMASFPRAS